MDENPLELDSEAVRRFDYQTVDVLSAVEHEAPRHIATPGRLLVLPGARFSTLVRDVPTFGERIHRAVRERHPGL